VAATVSADTVVTIARYLAGRVRRTRQSGDQPQLDLVLARPDGTFLRATGTDTDAVLKTYYANLATIAADPQVRALLLRLAAGIDPSTALVTNGAEIDSRGEVGDNDIPERP
jgi:hypothetical protein